MNEVHGKLKFCDHDTSSKIMVRDIWKRLGAGWIQRIEIDQRKPLWRDSYEEKELDLMRAAEVCKKLSIGIRCMVKLKF